MAATLQGKKRNKEMKQFKQKWKEREALLEEIKINREIKLQNARNKKS